MGACRGPDRGRKSKFPCHKESISYFLADYSLAIGINILLFGGIGSLSMSS